MDREGLSRSSIVSQRREPGGWVPDLSARLRRLARDHRNLLDRLSRAEELADAIAVELEALTLQLDGGPAGAAVAAAGGASWSRHRTSEAQVLLRRAAEGGAGELALRRLADGSWLVRVDAGKEFALPATLGELLAVLAWDSGISSDSLVGWKTIEEIGELLAKRTGRTLSKHAVTQNVYRLRHELFERGNVNPHLVQTNRRYGLRFALRRREEESPGPPADPIASGGKS